MGRNAAKKKNEKEKPDHDRSRLHDDFRRV